jgi:hypothetical protein
MNKGAVYHIPPAAPVVPTTEEAIKAASVTARENDHQDGTGRRGIRN